ncbi:hypothetical protein LTR56_004188 [Elasticomyces elasticus]|nr:hypothetical protein LTR56_004188 [Elasticomyces elasticus]KAK3655078.1 hypothetical protein LTR22_010387 [Elasticomyces elasticus]KAK4910873.1 hypothetical protein LTR49_020484 [Elasticomyces elasticus]KAK5750292.1 hypothetical protein LTS12_019630 [Elasticomyces elasticus]
MASCTNCGKAAAGEVSLRRCANCRDAQYCSRACQRADWKQHKQVCELKQTTTHDANASTETSAGPSDSPSQAHGTARADGAPTIALLSLEKQGFFDEMFEGLVATLKAKGSITEYTDRDGAYDMLTAATRPDIVLATDAALPESKYMSIRRKAYDYATNGGTLIFMGHFSSFARPPAIKTMFNAFGLPWESGDYHRTTFDVNAAMTRFDTASLVPSYSQKALHLQHVAREDAIYLPTSSSQTQSMVFAPQSVNLAQSPAVLGVCGRGKVGYLGDVNAEEGTTKVVLAMCGIAV